MAEVHSPPVEKMLCTVTNLPFAIDDRFLNPATWRDLDVNEILHSIDNTAVDLRQNVMVAHYRDGMRAFNQSSEMECFDACMVVLGYALHEDGSMRNELIDRLRFALAKFNSLQLKTIIVSGGNPKNGISEAQAMQNWLIKNGVPSHQVLIENASSDTVQNIQNIVPLLQEHQLKNVLIITSEWHMMRALGLFLCLTSAAQMRVNIFFAFKTKNLPLNHQVLANEGFLFWKDIGRILNIWKYPLISN